MSKDNSDRFFFNKHRWMKIFFLFFSCLLCCEFIVEAVVFYKRERFLQENSSLLRNGTHRREVILKLGEPDSSFFDEKENSEFLFWTVSSSKGPFFKLFDPFKSKGNFEITIKINKNSEKIEKIYSGIN